MNATTLDMYRRIVVVMFVLVTVIGLNWSALAGSDKARTHSTESTASESRSGPTGEQLWSNNCQRCHNLQSPAIYSPAQWQVVVHHMRVRANITGADQRAILEFLKSSSR